MYTVVPPESLLDIYDEEPQSLIRATVVGVPVLIAPLDGGEGRIERVLSTDPDHFLQADIQPGTVVSLR